MPTDNSGLDSSTSTDNGLLHFDEIGSTITLWLPAIADSNPRVRALPCFAGAGACNPYGVTDALSHPSPTRSISRLPIPDAGEKDESGLTVFVAFAANVLVALAKSAAAFLTGSAALEAEAA